MAIESINPANDELLRTFDPLDNEAARQKIALRRRLPAYE